MLLLSRQAIQMLSYKPQLQIYKVYKLGVDEICKKAI